MEMPISNYLLAAIERSHAQSPEELAERLGRPISMDEAIASMREYAYFGRRMSLMLAAMLDKLILELRQSGIDFDPTPYLAFLDDGESTGED